MPSGDRRSVRRESKVSFDLDNSFSANASHWFSFDGGDSSARADRLLIDFNRFVLHFVILGWFKYLIGYLIFAFCSVCDLSSNCGDWGGGGRNLLAPWDQKSGARSRQGASLSS